MLAAAGVADGAARAQRAARLSRSATSTGRSALLYVDGAHRFGPARDDVARWGARVAPGGAMLVHDSYSSIGVTGALLARVRGARRLALRGRTGSLAGPRGSRRRCAGRERARDAARQPRSSLVRPQRALQGARHGGPAPRRAPPRPGSRDALAVYRQVP